MGNAIGIRSTASEIFFVVVTGTTDLPSITAKNKLVHPVSYELPDALAWYREQIILVCREFEVSACGIRTTEPLAMSKGASFTRRCNIEGVAMEAVASIGLKVCSGPIATISSLMGLKNARRCLDEGEFKGLPEWSKLSKNYKEAALASLAGLNL